MRSAIVLFLCATAPGGERPAPKPEVAFAELVGSYYYGDGMGINCTLDVEAEGKFSFRWRGCLGEYGRNHGPATIRYGHLILSPAEPNEDGFGGTPTDFIPVRWGDRTYLVPTKKGVEFCNAINLGREPRKGPHGRFYLRRDDWTKRTRDLPSLPEGWRSMLLPKPLRGSVNRALPDGKAEVNLGRRQGVFVGLELYVEDAGFGFVVVRSVDDASCIVAPKHDDLAPEFKTGQRVFSSLMDRIND